MAGRQEVVFGDSQIIERLHDQAKQLGPIGQLEWDLVEDRIISCSPEVPVIFEMTREQFLAVCTSLTTATKKVVHPADFKRHRAAAKEFVESGFLDFDYRIITATGATRRIRHTTHLTIDGDGRPYAATTLQEIPTLDQTKPANKRTVATARLLADAREQERERVMRRIHKEVGQVATRLRTQMSWVVRTLAARAKLPEQSVELMSPVNTTIDELRDRFRADSLELVDAQLVAAIRQEASRFAETTGCRYVLAMDEFDLEPALARDLVILRTVQEALSSIAQHAIATDVTIELESVGDRVQLVMTDNGVGITEQQIVSPSSLGLVSMRERALGYGGELTIQRLAEAGTRLTLLIPRQLEVRETSEGL